MSHWFRGVPRVATTGATVHRYNPPMNIGLRELEIFCAVVQRASFTKAAEQVHLA